MKIKHYRIYSIDYACKRICLFIYVSISKESLQWDIMHFTEYCRMDGIQQSAIFSSVVFLNSYIMSKTPMLRSFHVDAKFFYSFHLKNLYCCRFDVKYLQ